MPHQKGVPNPMLKEIFARRRQAAVELGVRPSMLERQRDGSYKLKKQLRKKTNPVNGGGATNGTKGDHSIPLGTIPDDSLTQERVRQMYASDELPPRPELRPAFDQGYTPSERVRNNSDNELAIKLCEALLELLRHR